MRQERSGGPTGFGVGGTSKPPFYCLVCLNLVWRGKFRRRTDAIRGLHSERVRGQTRCSYRRMFGCVQVPVVWTPKLIVRWSTHRKEPSRVWPTRGRER